MWRRQWDNRSSPNIAKNSHRSKVVVCSNDGFIFSHLVRCPDRKFTPFTDAPLFSGRRLYGLPISASENLSSRQPVCRLPMKKIKSVNVNEIKNDFELLPGKLAPSAMEQNMDECSAPWICPRSCYEACAGCQQKARRSRWKFPFSLSQFRNVNWDMFCGYQLGLNHPYPFRSLFLPMKLTGLSGISELSWRNCGQVSWDE